MEGTESIKELTAALAKAQIAFLPIKRTEKVSYPTAAGPKSYKYAPLSDVIEATKKALSDNGLAVIQRTKLVDGNLLLETILSHVSGDRIVSEMYVGKQDQSPQSEGSALTYKRRYGQSAILCVASEDDDAEKAEAEKAEAGKNSSHPVTAPKLKKTPPAQGTPEHFCEEHKVTRDRHEKDGRVWYSHRLPDGSYCNEAKPKKKDKPADTPEAIEPSVANEKQDEPLFSENKGQETTLAVEPPITPGTIATLAQSQAPPKSLIDIDWLNETLAKLRKKGLKVWSEAILMKRLDTMTTSKNKSLEEAVSKLTHEQAVKLVAQIKEHLELA